MNYTFTHKLAIAIAVLGAIALLIGMATTVGDKPVSVLGFSGSMTIRKASVAVWAIVIPAWFTIEEWWAPTDPQALAAFHRSQGFARYAWLVAGIIVATIVGIQIPDTPKAMPVAPQTDNAQSTKP